MKLLNVFLYVSLFFSTLAISQVRNEEEEGMLSALFRSMEKKYSITLSYDSDLIKNIPVQIDTAGLDLSALLKRIEDKTAFDFELTNNNVVLVKPKTKGSNFKISGRIFDGETKEALAGGLLTNESKSFSRPTGINGEFSLNTVYSKDDYLTIRYLGYKSLTIPFSAFSAGNPLSLAMTPDIINLEEVVLTTYMSSGINYNRLNNSLDIKPENLSLLPGQTDADLLLSIEALPGINSPDGKAGSINIRGSSADQTLITFDNIPIYHKGHFFGTVSPFNPKVVENLSVYRSSFSAEKGGRVGGAIEIKSKQFVPDSMQSGLSLSTIDASAFTTVPLIKNKLSLMVAGRSSYPFDWQSPKLKAISNFVFQESEIQRARDKRGGYDLRQFDYRFNDFNSKMIFSPNEKQKVTISLLKISNKMAAQIYSANNNLLTSDSVGFGNWGINGQWENRWTKNTISRLNVTNSSYNQQAKQGITNVANNNKDLEQFKNTADDFSAQLETDFYSKKNYFVKTGYVFNHHHIVFDRNRTIFAQQPDVFLNDRTGTVHSGYASFNTLFYKFHSSVGVRGNYFSLTKNVNFEPRVSLNYLVSNTITAKASWGLQRQFVSQVPGFSVQSIGGIDNLLWVLSDGKEIPVVKSNQVMAGAMYEKKGWLLDLECYYKKTDDLTISNITNFYSPTKFFYGNSYTIGADLLVKKRWKKFDVWASYTLSDSKMQFDSLQADPFTSLYNQKHVLDLDVLYKLGKFKFSTGWKYRSGLAALPGIRSLLLRGATPNNSIISNPANQTIVLEGAFKNDYPSFHQLDISVVYDFPTKRKQWNGSVGASIVNVYNQKNIIEQFVRRKGVGNTYELANRYSMGFAPNVFISVNF